ncbi:MAG: ribonuclease HIII [Coprobacillus sp.]|nr:ribonuclease HIII [Coprobacillus sp.]
MSQEYVTLMVTEEEANKVDSLFSSYKLERDEQYVSSSYKVEDTLIKIYESGSLLLSGENPLGFWRKNLSFIRMWLDEGEQIGSDEVGNGDYFLPLIVCSVYIRPSEIKVIEDYHIRDSKKMSDDEIRRIGPELVEKFNFVKLTLHNKDYNSLYEKGFNSNGIKALLHNKAFLEMKEKHSDCQSIYLDQFVNEKKYYSYLDGEENVATGVTFLARGESYYPSVALASVIARYNLLLYKDKLEAKYKMSFPTGGGSDVDEFQKQFVNKYGKEELEKIAKTSFANFKKI